jgi:nitrate/TMAO reductase-like tetraheme cytochrome c subunit
MTRRSLGILLVSLVGIPAGVGAFTFVYAKGFSYLSPDPRACVNCHVMNPQYDAWLTASPAGWRPGSGRSRRRPAGPSGP